MYTAHRNILRFGAAATVAWMAGCSLMVEFDPAGRPCNEARECLPNYACMGNTCIRTRSVAEYDTCASTPLCQEGFVCSSHDFVCRRPCQRAYGTHNECGSEAACVTIETTEGETMAACAKSECGNSDDCPPSEIETPTCVRVTDTAGICLPSCAITCIGDFCADDCRTLSSTAPERACQPLGADETMVCITAGTIQEHGAECELTTARCDQTHICIRESSTESSGVCKLLCNASLVTPCAATESPSDTCVAHDFFAVCQANVP